MSRRPVTLGAPARERRLRRARGVGAVTVPAVLATLAVLHPGTPVSQVDLHDGAVWLTNESQRTLGRYNPAVDELNAGLVPESADFDVLQDGDDVLLVEGASASVVDTASVTLAARAATPSGSVVAMAAGTVAVVDASGSAWVTTTTDLGTLSVDSDEPDLELGAGGRAVVSPGGTVLAVGADGAVSRAVPTDGGVAVEEDDALVEPPGGPLEQAAAVGEEVVALVGTTLLTQEADVDLGAYGDDLVLQQSGPASGVALVATPSALLEVPVDGGSVREHPTGSTGRPAAPVRVGTCAYGAWASAVASSVRVCEGAGSSFTDLTGMTTADELVFRVNRDVVVLNDTRLGRVWLPAEGPDLHEPSWQDVRPQQESRSDEQDSTERESDRTLQARCTEDSAPPRAADDEFGVRAGRTAILSVIDNDAASDCGILTISEHDPVPEQFGTLQAVQGGRALQLETRPEASGTVELTYTVSDGRGSSAPSTASVRVTVRPDGVNDAPVQERGGALTVEQGASASYDVLPDFRDPDGDELVLTGAVASGGGTVSTRQDGRLTFTSDGTGLGRFPVTVLVSDGAETVEGTVSVDVRPAGSVPPVVDPVQATTYVGEPVVVRPLRSVRSAGREPVRLAGVTEVSGTEVVSDLAAGTFTFTAPRAGTYYVPFVVTAAPQQAEGLARIDVLERPESAPPPVAVLDRALLPPGGEVTIAPLGNDTDPGGGVLVLQAVDTPPDSGLRVAVLQHQLLRITSERTLTGPVVLSYTVSNGTASARGQVIVQPVPASVTPQPPVVPDQRVTVRAGGVVTVAVLENAYDPDGEELRLLPTLPEPLDPADGLLFVSGDVLRYRAPDQPRQVHATFEVEDASRNRTAASLTVDVHASDAATKAPPRPRNLTARVLAGGTVRIPVPLTGIDADGDGVYLLGQDRAPLQGDVTDVGADWLEYTALPDAAGTDTFTYAVEDWVGQRAVATVRVGVAPRLSEVNEVVARPDEVTVRPGRQVEVRVLANDVDNGGGELELDPELVVSEGTEASRSGRRVVVRAPDEPGVVTVGYTARNTRGGSDSSVLSVVVDPEAEILAPVLQDVVVPATETLNSTSVEVDVLAVAQNPSGPLSDLRVGVHPSAADVATVTERGTVVVTLGPSAQTLPYVVSNTAVEGLRSYAFITVPALGDFPPVRRPGAPTLRVIAGEELRISLDEQVQVAPGRTARVGDLTKLTATRSDGAPTVAEGFIVFRAPRSYAGPASVSVEVTDGDPGDTTARTRVLTLPITVLAAEATPPRFTPSVLDVAPGEAPAVVDLSVFTSAPVETADGTTRYEYRLASPAPAGFRVALSGTRLSVAADATVARGTVGGVTVEIGYGGRTPVVAQVDFRVVASQRPLARVQGHVVPDAVGGRPSSVDVLRGAYNPFDPSPLEVVGAVVETAGGGDVSVAGSTVTVRPPEGYVGTLVVRYSVRDATRDAAREVEGRITVTVRGRPEAPRAPRVTEVRDGTVVLAWDAPLANGAPITGYRVTVQPGGTTRDCASTTCTIDGLTNGTEYRFTVAARNEVDLSDESPTSAPARPDARPGAPSAPRVERGDARLLVSWSAPTNTGTPITRYELEVSPAPASGPSTIGVTSTSHVVTGLQNGRAYTVRVRAVNDAPEPGDWSTSSAAVVPARAPDAPQQLAASSGELGERRIAVTWSPPGDDGGEAVSGYRVTVDGQAVAEVGGDVLSFAFDAERGRTYAIGVEARNTVGWSPAATTSGEIWSAPGTVTSLAAADVAAPGTPWNGGAVDVSWQPPADSGLDGRQGVDAYRVQLGGTVRELPGSQTSLRLDGLTGGAPYTVEVAARNARGAWGPATSVQVTPTTVPQAVLIGTPDTTTPLRAFVTWTPGGSGGSPVTGYRYEVRGDAGTELDGTTTTTSLTVDARAGEQLRIRVWAVNARGEGEPAERVVVVAAPPPEPEPEPDPEPDPEPPADPPPAEPPAQP
ncbi:fibronectin type III domain-containing protein [Cellulomonas carbonis]|uniref:fibronectin type III domain-containing protein n=1 Tax=Cellulomonas carbonis TaxID=1386092 RepID=UPI00126988C1|nr:Ig-like domain-containing protein [Cellulomonas carbonis]GGC09511.1 ATPase AAA [Cellulomonas carbonis]